MDIKFKKLNEDILSPSRGTEHSAGIDLRLSSVSHTDFGVLVMKLGVAVEIPEGYVGLLAVRSSTGAKGLQMLNSVGIIDADYRGELMMKCFYEYMGYDFPEIGDRIAQLVITPYVSGGIEIVEELNNTVRGGGGYGSTGRD